MPSFIDFPMEPIPVEFCPAHGVFQTVLKPLSSRM